MMECQECGHYIQQNEKLCCPHSLKQLSAAAAVNGRRIADRSCDLVDRLKAGSWDIPEMLAPEIAAAMCSLVEDICSWLESRSVVEGVGASAIRAYWIQHD